MLNALGNWKGKVSVNDIDYASIHDVPFSALTGEIHIKLYPEREKTKISVTEHETEYLITVKKYMTEEASPEFDFMAQWNDNKPMPMRIMQGKKLKETRGMVFMELHGLAKPTITCYCCGKELTNPISRYYGIGPICLGKLGIAREIDDVENIKEDLVKVTWAGWIIKSAITEEKEVYNE